MSPNAPRSTRQGSAGRPIIGTKYRVRLPPWLVAQVDALVAERSRVRRADPASRGRGSSRSAVLREVLVAGLLALRERGVEAPGFDPASALVEAEARGEPTGLGR